MGHLKREIDQSQHLADLFDYASPACIRRALRSIPDLQARAEAGCSTALAILVDLKTALGAYAVDAQSARPLTDRQRAAILLHLVRDRSVEETAEALGIDTSAVSHRVNGGIRRIIKFLTTGQAGDKEWGAWEVRFLQENYHARGAKYCAGVLDRRVSQIYGKARHVCTPGR